MQKIRFKPNESWDFNYGFHFSQTSDYGRYDRHTRYRNGQPRYAEWNYGPQLWQMNLLSATNTSKNAAYDQLAVRLAQQRFEESRIDRSLNGDTRSIREERVDAYSLNLDFTKIIDPKHRIFYGAEYVLNDVASSGTDEDISTGVSAEGPSRYPQATWQSLGIYINDEFKVAERTSVQAGIRYSQFLIDAEFDTTFYPFPFTTASINQGALTGSLGAVFRPTSTLVINANLGTAFRAPNVDDLGKVFDSEPGAVTVPNPNLKAEYAYNADLGFTKIIGEHVKVDMTGYYTLLENALVRRNDLLGGQDSILYDGELSQVLSIQNAAMAKVYGLQAGLEVKFPAGLTLMSDINFQKGEEELDDGTTSPSRHAAPLFGISRLRYKNGSLIVELNSQYQGERSFDELAAEEQGKDEIYAKDENGNNYSPAWYTLNLKSSYQFAQAVTLNLGLENITDQRYRPYSSGISGAGRNLVVSLRWDF